MKQETYFVTGVYRGRMHVDPMRVFIGESALEEAKAYARTLQDQPTIYLVSNDGPPKKVRGDFWKHSFKNTGKNNSNE